VAHADREYTFSDVMIVPGLPTRSDMPAGPLRARPGLAMMAAMGVLSAVRVDCVSDPQRTSASAAERMPGELGRGRSLGPR